jgi:hypothetical protein
MPLPGQEAARNEDQQIPGHADYPDAGTQGS